jgi:diguanylate cyclase (GGDEF)-like protein
MRRRKTLWAAIAVSLALVGAVASILGASAMAQDSGGDSRQVAVASADAIASTMKLELQHQQDLSISAAALAVDNRTLTQAEFAQWTKSIHAFSRYPELQGISELQMITPAQLPSFAAAQEADPAGPLSSGAFAVTPAGRRPYYCFISANQSRSVKTDLPAGLDYCTTALGTALLQARSSGASTYLPYKSGKTEELAIGTAVYSGGGVPSTVAARQSAFIGWTGTEILPGVVLANALAGHASTLVSFRYGQSTSKIGFTAGAVRGNTQTTTVDLHNGWFVVVRNSVTGSELWDSGTSLALLFGGIALCWLLAILVYVLGTSRSRALQLVHERTDELRHQAFHDSLTGLPNRALILEGINEMMKRARLEHLSMATLFLDLDDFKDINDTLGHRSGDELLTEVGARLKSVLGDGDFVGRLGGDEFVMVTTGSSLGFKAEVEAVADRIFAVLLPPFRLPGSEVLLNVTASIGIATGDRSIPEELLRDADIALYLAKGAGKNCAEVFTPSMQVSVDDHRNLEVDLHAALEANQFFLLYQPMVDLASGAVSGFEALLRWRHPTRGIVSPKEFIPALEASGMIIPVGRWVLETACRQGAAWQRQGHPIKISINVATAQLQRDGIADDTYHALAVSGFDPCMLVLEITETTLMQDVEEIVARLDLLKAIGVRIAIDDFGTGFSSLARLHHFPIDILKIDQAFVSQREDSEMPAVFIRTIVQLGKSLDLEILAEGIETQGQRNYLSAEGVDTGQGFLFAQPLDIKSAERFLHDNLAVPVLASSTLVRRG